MIRILETFESNYTDIVILLYSKNNYVYFQSFDYRTLIMYMLDMNVLKSKLIYLDKKRIRTNTVNGRLTYNKMVWYEIQLRTEKFDTLLLE